MHNTEDEGVVVDEVGPHFDPYLVHRPERDAVAAIIERAAERLGEPYSTLDYNCEHFATEAVFGEPSSPQLSRAVGTVAQVGLLAGLGYALYQLLKGPGPSNPPPGSDPENA